MGVVTRNLRFEPIARTSYASPALVTEQDPPPVLARCLPHPSSLRLVGCTSLLVLAGLEVCKALRCSLRFDRSSEYRYLNSMLPRID
jgi:hypothetical protein